MTDHLRRHRPVVPVVAGFATGIALDRLAGPPAWCWVAAGLGMVLACLWSLRRGARPWVSCSMAAVLALCAGGACHALRFRVKPPWHLKSVPLVDGGLYFLDGTVSSEPQWQYRDVPFRTDVDQSAGFSLLRMELAALSGDGEEWRRCQGGLAVFIDGPVPEFYVGDRIRLLAPVTRNRPATNPGEPDRALHYERAGSYASASLRSAEGIRLLERPPWWRSLPVCAGRLRGVLHARVRARLSATGSVERAGMMCALLFGRRGALTPRQQQLLVETGTLHFLAISGLHVGIFCLFVSGALTLVAAPVRLRAVLTIALVWSYVLFTGSHVSALRAGWMLTFLLAAPVLGRRRDPLSALMAAALGILVVWPQQLFSPGFQLTFVAVWAMVCIYPALRGILWPWQDLLDRVQAPEERPVLVDLWLYARSYALLSGAIWVATTPILAYHFNLVSLTAPVLNLVVWPLVLALLTVGFGVLLCLAVCGWLCSPLVTASLELTDWINALAEGARSLPGSGLYGPAPAGWWLALFYACLGAWVIRHRLEHGRFVLAALAVATAVGYVAADVGGRTGHDFELVVLDVGHGQAAAARAPGCPVLLFDAGSVRSSAADALSSLLWRWRATRAGAVVLSHANADHCSFLPHLVARFAIGRAVLPTGFGRSGYGVIVTAALDGWRIRADAVSSGDRLRTGALTCEVLHPDARFAGSNSVSPNDRSLVLLCRCGECSVLLPGDVEGAGLQRLICDHGPRLHADILVMPHHGSYHACTGEFLDCVRPQAAIVSGGDASADPRALAELRSRGIPLWRTDVDGAVEVALREGGIRITGFVSGRSAEFTAAR
jgi:competence protein ComEC